MNSSFREIGGRDGKRPAVLGTILGESRGANCIMGSTLGHCQRCCSATVLGELGVSELEDLESCPFLLLMLRCLGGV